MIINNKNLQSLKNLEAFKKLAIIMLVIFGALSGCDKTISLMILVLYLSSKQNETDNLFVIQNKPIEGSSGRVNRAKRFQQRYSNCEECLLFKLF